MATLGPIRFQRAIDWMGNQGSRVNNIGKNNSMGLSKPNGTEEKRLKGISKHNPITLLFNRNKIRLSSKIKYALVKLNRQKAQFKREQILKNRQEKLQKFKINYIPLCSDEDWEAMGAFYSKEGKE
jgi:hypothetical protein